MNAALDALKPFEYERLAEEQVKLFFFYPMMTHSLQETAGIVYFHPQIIADFGVIEEIALKVLDALQGAHQYEKPTSEPRRSPPLRSSVCAICTNLSSVVAKLKAARDRKIAAGENVAAGRATPKHGPRWSSWPASCAVPIQIVGRSPCGRSRPLLPSAATSHQPASHTKLRPWRRCSANSKPVRSRFVLDWPKSAPTLENAPLTL